MKFSDKVKCMNGVLRITIPKKNADIENISQNTVVDVEVTKKQKL